MPAESTQKNLLCVSRVHCVVRTSEKQRQFPYTGINQYGSNVELRSTALSSGPGPVSSYNRHNVAQCRKLVFPYLVTTLEL